MVYKRIKKYLSLKMNKVWDFPGSPVVKTLPSNEGGCGFNPWSGAKIPHVLQPKSQNIKQKQYCNKFNKDLKKKKKMSKLSYKVRRKCMCVCVHAFMVNRI